MTLKFQVESLEGIDESVANLYTEQDGKFVLGIEGLPEDKSAEYEDRIQKMDAKVNELLGEKKEEAKKRKLAEEAARKEAEEAARSGGDIDALDKSWQEKYTKREQELLGEYEPQVEKFKSLLHKSTVTADAMKLASEIAVQGSAEALLPHLTSRLAMEVKDDIAMTVVRGADGKPSALTIDDLKNEFISNPVFAPLIVGSKASGGGAAGSDSSGGAAKTLSRSQFNDKSPKEQMAFIGDGGSITD